MAYTSAVNPFDHPCDVDTLDYSQVDAGLITCTVCPRTWNLRIIPDGRGFWNNSCQAPFPKERVDWLAGIKPYPAPTEEEILSNRKLRQEMIDQKEHERIVQFQDGKGALDWLKKERGAGGKVDAEWMLERISVETKGFSHDLSMTITAKPQVLMVILRALRTM